MTGKPVAPGSSGTVTRILLAIKPASYEETIAALDQAASIAK